MELVLRRRPSDAHCTIGELYADGVFECYTLEDVVRQPAEWKPGDPVDPWKIQNETAIPAMRYVVTVTKSQHFGRDLPLLNAVPGYQGVRIHPGNTDKDTEGCILTGENVAGDAIVESKHAFARVFEKIEGALAAGEEVWIDVRNP